MADFEDANAPTWDNLVEGQVNLRDAVRRHHHASPSPRRASSYALNEKTAVADGAPARLAPRREARRASTASPCPASLFDFGLFFFHNAQRAARARHRPVLLPAEDGEPPRGAALERRLRRARRRRSASRAAPSSATVLIETLPAAFEMDEILYELREHSAGLNCGRWDYIFSFIKKLRAATRARVLPDRGAGHDGQGVPARPTRSCSSRPATAAASTPWAAWPRRSRSRTTRRANEAALEKVRADKLREVQRRPRRHLGRAPGPGAGRQARSSTRTCRRRTSSTCKRDDVHVDRAPTCSRVPDGHAHRGGPAPQHARRHPVPRGVAARQRLRAALQPDGGRGDRRDLPRAGLAVAPPPARARRRRSRSPPSASRSVVDEEMARVRGEVGAERFAGGQLRRGARPVRAPRPPPPSSRSS